MKTVLNGGGGAPKYHKVSERTLWAKRWACDLAFAPVEIAGTLYLWGYVPQCVRLVLECSGGFKSTCSALTPSWNSAERLFSPSSDEVTPEPLVSAHIFCLYMKTHNSPSRCCHIDCLCLLSVESLPLGRRSLKAGDFPHMHPYWAWAEKGSVSPVDTLNSF